MLVEKSGETRSITLPRSLRRMVAARQNTVNGLSAAGSRDTGMTRSYGFANKNYGVERQSPYLM
jgi:hypothetical protein